MRLEIEGLPLLTKPRGEPIVIAEKMMKHIVACCNYCIS